jgi:hypothetical protein
LELAMPMTPLEDGDRVLTRAHEVRLRVQDREICLRLPGVADFLRMKLDNFDRATRDEAHKEKDALDLFGYVRWRTAEKVGAALADPRDGQTLTRLLAHFGDEDSPGVRRVLAFVGGLPNDQRRLVAKDVVRVFTAVAAAAGQGCSLPP